MLTDQEVSCAISSSKHSLVDPVSLRKCGHLVCNKCLNGDYKSITCNICVSTNNKTFNKIEISTTSKQEIEKHLDAIFEILQKEANVKIKELKDQMKDKVDYLEAHFSYLEEQIDTRLESIKTEIDQIGETLKVKVKEMESNVLMSSKSGTKLKNLNSIIEDIKRNRRNKTNLSNEYAKSCQNGIKLLSDLKTSINNNQKLPEMKMSTKMFDENSFGKIYSGIPSEIENLNENKKQEINNVDINEIFMMRKHPLITNPQNFPDDVTRQFSDHISHLEFGKIEATIPNASNIVSDTWKDNQCQVCGDKQTGSHFGGISCESCKAFFRRSVQRNRYLDYKCAYTSNCKINVVTRKICQLCRYNACLSIGMRPKWVLSDEEREQKYGNRRKRKSFIDEDNLTPEKLIEIFDKFGIDAINDHNKSLTNYDKFIINKLVASFYSSTQDNKIDMNLIEQKSNALNNESNKNYLKLTLASEFVSEFVKLIPDFCNLEINDQMSLLRGSFMEIFICSSQNLFNKEFSNIASKEINESPIYFTDSINLSIFRLIWSTEIYEKIVNFLKSMNDLYIDETTLILYLTLILFNPDRQNLIERDRIFKIQTKYSTLLHKYLFYKYHHQFEVVHKIFSKLLLKMIDLRNLHQVHSSMLLDVTDSTELEFLPNLIINDNKNEVYNFKGVHKNNGEKQFQLNVFNDSDFPMDIIPS